MQLSDVSILSPETVEHPHAQYELLRDEAPVHWDPKLEVFCVSRYEDVRTVLLDAELYSSQVGAMTAPPPPEAIAVMASGLPPANTLITADPPEHLRYRSLVARAFTPRRVARLEEEVAELAHRLVDGFVADGHVELVKQFAAPLPLTVIADQLGVPRDRIDDFKTWSDAFMDLIGGLASNERSVQCAEQILDCQRYFTNRIEEFRADPPDNMLGVLIKAELTTDEGKRPLDPSEMTSILSQFMLAGNETSTAAITATWRYLIEQPDVQEKVRADRSLVPGVMEEVFRLESPVQNNFRVSTRATTLAGVEIPAYTRIAVMIGSANRDPRVFPDPERIDPTRENVREHLAFGQGNHYCIGAGLARLEGTIALNVLLDRLKNVRFTPGQDALRHNPIFIARALTALHIDFDA